MRVSTLQPMDSPTPTSTPDERPADELDDVADRFELRGRYEMLLQELRVVLPGVQVLLAFLFTVPFAGNFDRLDRTGRDLFAVALVSSFGAVVFLLGPAVFHRTGNRTARRERLIWGVRSAMVGLALLALALLSALACVTRFVFDDRTAVVITGVAVVVVIGLWIVLPRTLFGHHDQE